MFSRAFTSPAEIHSVVGPRSNNSNTPANAGSQASYWPSYGQWPLAVAFSTSRRTPSILASSKFINYANAMSGFLRKRPPSSGGTPTGPSSCEIFGRSHPLRTHWRPTAKKQRFIDAAKMLLDIAKESSDVFPPLKSCLGGINALIKHYDVRRYRVTLYYAEGYRLAIHRRERQTQ